MREVGVSSEASEVVRLMVTGWILTDAIGVWFVLGTIALWLISVAIASVDGVWSTVATVIVAVVAVRFFAVIVAVWSNAVVVTIEVSVWLVVALSMSCMDIVWGTGLVSIPKLTVMSDTAGETESKGFMTYTIVNIC
jgi:hypothetical protein